MAVLTALNAIAKYNTSEASMVALFAMRNVTTGDTIDISTLVFPQFQVIKSAVVIGVSDFVEIAAVFAGTVVTMPGGLNKSSAYMLIIGC